MEGFHVLWSAITEFNYYGSVDCFCYPLHMDIVCWETQWIQSEFISLPRSCIGWSCPTSVPLNVTTHDEQESNGSAGGVKMWANHKIKIL